ncbi:MAG: GNAT family N-acetyltransferase [Candidatus Limnocylindria bacterium]
MTPTIRDARLEDVPGIVDVHIRTWQVAYLGQLPDELLAAQEARRADRTEIWDRAIRNAADDHRRILVAEEDGRVVGFASAGPARDEGEAIGEIYAIYLDPGSWGSGIGRELLARSTEWLAGGGFDEAILWVLGSNARARRFYETAGWHTDGGAKMELMLGSPLEEVRYRRSLAAR